jgi:hypothetical protein
MLMIVIKSIEDDELLTVTNDSLTPPDEIIP